MLNVMETYVGLLTWLRLRWQDVLSNDTHVEVLMMFGGRRHSRVTIGRATVVLISSDKCHTWCSHGKEVIIVSACKYPPLLETISAVTILSLISAQDSTRNN